MKKKVEEQVVVGGEEIENQFDIDNNVELGTESVENTVVADEEKEPELSETEKLTIELAEMKDKYIRLYSEFDNFRKRTSKEKLELIHTASESVIIDLLSVVDDYERALANAKDGEISDGIALIFSKLNNILHAKGVKEMVAKGEVFNADIHDCITQFAAPTEADKGKVIEVIEKGYLLKDKVIRFAKVIVGN
jgi:molecular chaperone GrpE